MKIPGSLWRITGTAKDLRGQPGITGSMALYPKFQIISTGGKNLCLPPNSVFLRFWGTVGHFTKLLRIGIW